MSFFKKLKNMIGSTGVKLEYTWIENPFPFKDPMIKATLQASAEHEEITIVGVTGTFYAQRTVDGREDKLILGTDKSTLDHCSRVERNGEYVSMLPDVLKPGTSSSYGLFVNNMDLAASLAAWGINSPAAAAQKGVKFFLKGEVDVKETLEAFDPSIIQEINVV